MTTEEKFNIGSVLVNLELARDLVVKEEDICGVLDTWSISVQENIIDMETLSHSTKFFIHS